MNLQRIQPLCLLLLAACAPVAGSSTDTVGLADGCRWVDEHTIAGPRDFETGYAPKAPDGSLNAVIEIPAGTNGKWEVNAKLKDGSKPTDGHLRWEFKNEKPRVVKYLPYPGNYGFVPGTRGGDDDPLDIIVLGPALKRGEVAKVRLIGILKLIDDGEVDDKLIAVSRRSPLSGVGSLADLDEQHPGASRILEIWFTSYKGPDGGMTSPGFGDAQEAEKVLTSAIATEKARE